MFSNHWQLKRHELICLFELIKYDSTFASRHPFFHIDGNNCGNVEATAWSRICRFSRFIGHLPKYTTFTWTSLNIYIDRYHRIPTHPVYVRHRELSGKRQCSEEAERLVDFQKQPRVPVSWRTVTTIIFVFKKQVGCRLCLRGLRNSF